MKYYKIGGEGVCECDEVTWIGEDGGGNEYYQCEGCESVIVKPEGSSSLEEGADCKLMEGEITCSDKPEGK